MPKFTCIKWVHIHQVLLHEINRVLTRQSKESLFKYNKRRAEINFSNVDVDDQRIVEPTYCNVP